MPEKVVFESSEHLSRTKVADRLRTIADKLEEGMLTLQNGDRSTTLEPGDDIEFEIEVEEDTSPDGTSVELELELSWTVGGKTDRVTIQ